MHVITERRLKDFAADHPDAREPLRVWVKIMERKRYAMPAEVEEDFPSASFLGNNLTVFNIGGNKYRLSVTMRYDLGRVFIRHVMTHEEYDRRTQTKTL